jgi:hypothetical protein
MLLEEFKSLWFFIFKFLLAGDIFFLRYNCGVLINLLEFQFVENNGQQLW